MGQRRGYWNFQFGPSLTPAMKWLMIANTAVFLLQVICRVGFGRDFLAEFFALNSYAVVRGAIWQPVTYMFLHANGRHLVFNMLWLWLLGCPVEGAWGTRPIVYYYFFTGIGGGLLTLIMNLGVPSYTLGASGAAFGIIVAFGMTFPEDIVHFLFIFPMRGKHFAMLAIGLEFLMTIDYTSSGGRGIARFAHLGGALFGYLYLKYGDKIRYSMPRIRLNFGGRKEGKKSDKAKEWEIRMQQEIDPILDKISREGFDSLTWREKKILKRGRGRKR
jgi:membrane associated rhomboid family serine protease